MPVIDRNSKPVKLEDLTDEQIKARWQALLPKFVRYLIGASIVSIAIFLANHFYTGNQKFTDLATIAFNICSLFTVCFAFLTAAALFFRTDAWRTKA